jgi:hypothetical protein
VKYGKGKSITPWTGIANRYIEKAYQEALNGKKSAGRPRRGQGPACDEEAHAVGGLSRYSRRASSAFDNLPGAEAPFGFKEAPGNACGASREQTLV